MNPYDDIRRFWRALDKLFEELFDEFEQPTIRPMHMQSMQNFRAPYVELNDNGEELVITAELPGVNKEDIDLVVNEDNIEIRAERKDETKEENEFGSSIKRSVTKFYKMLPLPVKVDPKTAKATYNNGILEIRVRKANIANSRKVKVE